MRTSFSLTRSCARVGYHAKSVGDSQKTSHLTLMFAVAPHYNVVHSQIARGGTNKFVTKDFAAEHIRSARREGSNNPWIVIDNAPCHDDLKLCWKDYQMDFLSILESDLPPYLCELNPIESMFNIIETITKKQMVEDEISRLPDETACVLISQNAGNYPVHFRASCTRFLP